MPINLLTLILVFISMGLLLLGIMILLTAISLLRPPRMTDGRAIFILRRLSPGDLGLRFEDQIFWVRDEKTGERLKIAGWWIGHPHAGGKCVVMIHGYSDAKVGAIAWAPNFHAMGMNILAIDLRAHGESSGRYSTAGYFERHDLNQVLDQLIANRPAEARDIVLFGISLGAAVAAAAAVLRNDLAAVILECPYKSFPDAAMSYGQRLGLPGGLFQRMAIRLAERISGACFSEVRPVDLIAKIPCPLLIVQSRDDLFVSLSDAAAIEAATRSRPEELEPTIYWPVEEAEHVLALPLEPKIYQQVIANFLVQAFQKSLCPIGQVLLSGPNTPFNQTT